MPDVHRVAGTPGVDLPAVMSAAYQPWEDKELSLKKEAKAGMKAVL